MSRVKAAVHALWTSVAAALILLAGYFVLTGPDTPHQAARNAEVAKAKICITELERRRPEVDADQDIARGDATPISLIAIPHDPPTPTAYYPDACKNSYEESDRSTGKWFKYGVEPFSFSAKSNEYHACRKAARDYVVRYNQRMIERAPDSVRKFCEIQSLDESGRRAAAMAAAFNSAHKPKYNVRGGLQENIGGVAHLSNAPWLIDLPQGAYLVILSRSLASNTACSPGEECPEVVGLAQLVPKGQNFSLVRRWDNVARLAEKGWSYGGLSCCGPSVTRYTELAVRQVYEGDDCRSERQTIFELTPKGPIDRGVIYMNVQLGRKGDYTTTHAGKIDNIVIGKSFDVVVPHTEIRESYELKSGRYYGPARSKLKC